MTPEELAGIHDRRLKVYGGKSVKPFLTRTALEQLGKDVEGLPGVFLQHLDSAFYQFQNESDWQERSYQWLLDVFIGRLPEWRDKCGRGLAAIEKAMQENRRTVDVTEGNPFLATVLDNEWVYQSYDSETTYFISGLMRRLLHESSTRGGPRRS
jgi:hypothetical protein